MSSEECRYSVRTPVQLHSELGYSGVLNKVKNLVRQADIMNRGGASDPSLTLRMTKISYAQDERSGWLGSE